MFHFILKIISFKSYLIIFISAILTATCFAQPDTSNEYDLNNIADSSLYPYKFISNSEAEKIIGMPVHLRDSLRKNSNGYLRLQFTYVSNTIDSASAQKRSLFFGYEKFIDNPSAKRAFDGIKAENETLYKLSALDNIGDEGFTLKDQVGFPFLMVLKSNKVYKFKMYYVADKKYMDEMLLIVKKIVSVNN